MKLAVAAPRAAVAVGEDNKKTGGGGDERRPEKLRTPEDGLRILRTRLVMESARPRASARRDTISFAKDETATRAGTRPDRPTWMMDCQAAIDAQPTTRGDHTTPRHNAACAGEERHGAHNGICNGVRGVHRENRASPDDSDASPFKLVRSVRTCATAVSSAPASAPMTAPKHTTTRAPLEIAICAP